MYMGNKFCLEMEKSALKHMLLYIAEGHLHFILLSTTQTQLFSVKTHSLNKCIFEIISCFAKEQINMKICKGTKIDNYEFVRFVHCCIFRAFMVQDLQQLVSG